MSQRANTGAAHHLHSVWAQAVESATFIQYLLFSTFYSYSVLMNYLIFWIFGFGTLWAGLTLFDDEVLLIVSMLVGSGLVLMGLLSSPLKLQIGIEVVFVASLFYVCMECVERGNS